MRLWHYKLIPHLPRLQLLGQHRECCAMRGKFWGKKHSTVNYVWKHAYLKLWYFHLLVMREMRNRGYKVHGEWYYPNYRGKKLGYDENIWISYNYLENYPEHNNEYLQECLDNLKNKGINIVKKL